jgi:hypothetical protein
VYAWITRPSTPSTREYSSAPSGGAYSGRCMSAHSVPSRVVNWLNA